MRARLALISLFLLACPPAVHAVEPIQKKTCDLPPALSGVSGHVLMRYTVNIHGLVNFVEPVFSQVEPPGRTEDLVGHLETCLQQWKYPPADKIGWAKSFMELMLAFHYFRPATAPGDMATLPGGRQVPRAWLDEMREMKLALADRLLAGPLKKELTGEGWVLRTNVRPAERAALAQAIEGAQESFSAVFPGLPAAGGHSMVLLVFGEEDHFKQVSAFDNLYSRLQPGGAYLPEERVAYTFAAARQAPLRISQNYVRHEVTHHLVHQRLAAGRDVPYWVDEGIACYVELLRAPKKGKVDRFRFVRGSQAEGSFHWNSPADDYLEAFQRAHGRLPDPARFLEGRFDSIDSKLAYGLSWILVHYLLNAEEGKLKEPFIRWMTGSMGTTDDPGLDAALGRPADQIFSALAAHVDSMKRGG